MIPPTVERKVKNETGAAVMSVSVAKSFKDLGGPPTGPPRTSRHGPDSSFAPRCSTI